MNKEQIQEPLDHLRVRGLVVLEAHGGDHVYEEVIAPLPEQGVLCYGSSGRGKSKHRTTSAMEESSTYRQKSPKEDTFPPSQ